MLLVTSNKTKALLNIRFLGRVRVEDFKSAIEDLVTELRGLELGFRYLVDFSHLESIDLDCVPEIGRIMELIGQAGAGLVVRYIPDPGKDIGMNILKLFHYPMHLKVENCENLNDVVRTLEL